MNFLDELQQRGLVDQATAFDALADHFMSAGRRAYCGFDATAPSLTVGNLVLIMCLRRLQEAGHTPYVIMGGATSLIGDPSGKSTERHLLDWHTVQQNLAQQKIIFERLLDFSTGAANAAVILNNADWLTDMTFIDALRDIGKHFSVNRMIKTDSVRSRLEREQGLSFTEFAYPLLQAWDFAHLNRHHGVTAQFGGADQWANILAGMDLTRRLYGEELYGLTCPLVMTADGKKFGKTEEGAVWLDENLTPPFAFYQFWMNASDRDVGQYLRFFTLLSLAEIDAIEQEHNVKPDGRHAQARLACEVTRLVHGAKKAVEAERVSAVLFTTGSIAELSLAEIQLATSAVPTRRMGFEELPVQGVPISTFLCLAEICASKREARELLAAGAIHLNGRRSLPDDVLRRNDLLFGAVAAIRRGKKTWKFVTYGAAQQ